MPFIVDDNIIGAHIGDEWICRECVTEDEWAHMNPDNVLTKDSQIEEMLCVRCTERI